MFDWSLKILCGELNHRWGKDLSHGKLSFALEPLTRYLGSYGRSKICEQIKKPSHVDEFE
jgi:hypothetical protein